MFRDLRFGLIGLKEFGTAIRFYLPETLNPKD